MIVLDSNFLIFVLQGHKKSIALYKSLSSKSQMGLSIISLTEILSGIKKSEFKTIKQAFQDLEVLPFSDYQVSETAAIYRQKYKLKTPDAIILASCEFGSHDFYTYDHDYKKIKKRWVKVLEFT